MFLKNFLVLISLLKVGGQGKPWDGPHVYAHRLPFNWVPTKQTIEIVADPQNEVYTGNTTVTAKAEVDLLQEFRLHSDLADEPKIVFIKTTSCKNATETTIETSDIETFFIDTRQEFGFRVSKPKNFRFRKGNMITVKLSFTSRVYENLKIGVFKPDITETQSVITMFQPSYARTVFPCFDEPLYRAFFTLGVKLKEENEENYIILSNMPGHKDADSGWYRFDQTKISLPAYLLAFALLNKNEYILVHSFAYSGRPINIYTNREYHNANKSFLKQSFEKLSTLGSDNYNDGREDAQTLELAISEILSSCETLFGVDLIWDKIDIVFINKSALLAMENPGLITVRIDQTGIGAAVDALAHEFVHFWTGIPITLDSYDTFWINEGLTEYISVRIRHKMHEKHRNIPYKQFSTLAMMYYYSFRMTLSVPDINVVATEDPRWSFFTQAYYQVSASVMANLDDFMGSTLIQGWFYLNA